MKNNVQLIGRLGADPEVKKFDSGKQVTNISLATNEYYYNDKKEKITKTTWHRLVLWNRLSELSEKYLLKGDEIAVDGKIVYREYTTENGEKKRFTEIEVSDLIFLGKKKEEEVIPSSIE